MAVSFVRVEAKDDGIRLDRWFSRHYPDLKNGQLQRLLRGKNIRVNGKKALFYDDYNTYTIYLDSVDDESNDIYGF